MFHPVGRRQFLSPAGGPILLSEMYYSVACKHGVSQNDKRCESCRRAKWARDNYDPEKTRIRNANVRAKHKDVINARRREKHRQNPEPHRAAAKKYRLANLEARRAYDRERREINSERQRKSQGVVYGSRTFEELLTLQNNCCVICGRSLPRDAAVDHDHFVPIGSANVRGVLHRRCNAAIGFLGEALGNQEVLANLKRAVDHVERGYGAVDYVWDFDNVC